MKNILTTAPRRALLFSLAGLTGLTTLSLHAEDSASASSPWQVRFSAGTLFNVSASFKGHPGLPTLANGADQPGAANYDNGYVGTDVSGDPTLSTYWGYSQTSQQILSSGNVTGLNFQRTSPLANAGSPGMDADPSVGGDLNLRRQVTEWGPLLFGLEIGASYNHIDAKDTSSYTTAGQRTTYSYGLPAPVNSALFPPGGYSGPFNGLGPIINPAATAGQTTTIPNAVQVSGSRSVEADIFGLRLGPYLEVPVTQRFTISVSVGGLLAIVHDQVAWSENLSVNTASVNGYWTGSSSVSGDSTGVTAGVYAGADLSYRFTKNWSLFGGARFQDAGTYSHSLGAGEMDLNLGQSVMVNLGLGYSF